MGLLIATEFITHYTDGASPLGLLKRVTNMFASTVKGFPWEPNPACMASTQDQGHSGWVPTRARVIICDPVSMYDFGQNDHLPVRDSRASPMTSAPIAGCSPERSCRNSISTYRFD